MPPFAPTKAGRAARARHTARVQRAAMAAKMRGVSRGAMTRYGRILRPQSRRVEVKAVDGLNGTGSLNTFTMNTTGTVTCLNMISTGSSFFNRYGRRIALKSLHFHGIIQNNGNSNVNTHEYLRFLIVYDRQANGALPALSDILQNTDQQANNTTSVFSDLNLNNRERFLILRDYRKEFPMVTGANAPYYPDGQTPYTLNEFIKLKDLLTHYKADSSPAVIGDIATGSLLLVTVGSQAAGADAYKLQCSWRLRFTEE